MPNDLRSELDELVKERENLEVEADAIKSFLTSPGPNNEAPPGLRGVSLVDDEGFPRADIDVWDVRVKRNRLACIETDHAALMKRIEDLVQQLHQEAKTKSAFRTSAIPPQARTEGRQPSLPTAAVPMEVQQQQHHEEAGGGGGPPKQPFALIDQVFRASPAEEAGLKEGDLLVGFGSVDSENHSNFTAIVNLVQNSVGRPIRVVVQRKDGAGGGGGGGGGKQVVVSLTPHTWSGRGLLGCHLSALSS